LKEIGNEKGLGPFFACPSGLKEKSID